MARGYASRGRGFRGNFRGRVGGVRGRGGRGRGGATANTPAAVKDDDGSKVEARFELARIEDGIEEKLGFSRYQEGRPRDGWMINMRPTLIKDDDVPGGRAGIDYYFIQDDGGMFKATVPYEPYFYIACKKGNEGIVEEWLLKRYEGLIYRILREKKEDLKMPNHLLGYQQLYLQLNFRNVSDLLSVRKDLLPVAQANSAKRSAVDAYAEVIQAASHATGQLGGGFLGGVESAPLRGQTHLDPRELITDIREYDVAYYLRVAIDNDYRVGYWYTVTASQGEVTLSRITDRVKRAEPVVMAFDIETTKAPLKFPDQAIDQVMMISYMIDGQGFLITNRDIVSEDIEDFDYTPKPEYEGPFTIFNEADEEGVLRRWFEHIREAKPTVMATFNGDLFDFPFVDARAKAHGMDMFAEIGFAKDSEDEYKSRACAHMDCFRWVKRDSYLPQGSQGLKAVTTAKLGYNPMELDPELMTPYASEHPQILAQYSVSDAVATYYLYMKYVHPFIFSLCNIIPLNPDDVLRKGSGTLCETLLMVEAYRGKIIMPNRHEDPTGIMYQGHLLASETYVGGHVEALEAGVFRSDIPTHFRIVPEGVNQLILDLDRALKFCIQQEFKKDLSDITNYDDVKASIQSKLEELRDNPLRTDKPLIYHLDVAAMYPNIMLSNRLQPDSVVSEAMCAVCDYNRPGKQCDRRMTWAWRGEFFPAHRDEFNMVRNALDSEMLPPKHPDGPKRRFDDLTEAEQTALLHKRLGDYSRKVYRRTKDTKVVEREAIICQRENPFYIDTVRNFRDRRYEYKGLHKEWKKKLDVALGGNSFTEIEEARKMIVLWDSLQLAHKCILNSFYGYVMRKGARWHSMEMAGITCLTGARIIQMARQLVEQIGRPLELDTDGIWCMLPGCFPENFAFQVKSGKPLAFSYPCTMLNHLVYDQFTNHQYHSFDKTTESYAIHSENSIFFELDGPYKAMILPSSKEEDKLLKKRYAVFNEDGSLAELKGFEVKRRGELQLIKIFQTQLFEKFLLGSTTEECYAAVAKVADQWLDVLFSKGKSLSDEELVDLIAENRSMSKTLAEYGGQKSTSISTAKRLAEFLGSQMVKDRGLACKFIISAKPAGAPVTDRAVPVAIFSAEENVKRSYLRKWLHDSRLTDFDIRTILDWDYYIERLGSVIQKLITIPAAMQKVSNPVPRIRHPDWLHKRVLNRDYEQHKVTDFFKKKDPATAPISSRSLGTGDIEDIGNSVENTELQPKVAKVTRQQTTSDAEPLPDYSVNYSKWLKYMRPRWKAAREYRARGESDGISFNVPSMFHTSLTRSYRAWDIVQIRVTNTPGRFTMWVAMDDEFVSVPLRIPRQFYINFKVAPSDFTFQSSYTAEAVTRSLPRSQPCLHLYRITVAEDVYLRSESHFANLLNHPNVDGVYETQVNWIPGVLQLGTRCTTNDTTNISLNRAKDVGFDLQQLMFSARSSTAKYLPQLRPSNIIFLFHSTTAPRHVFGVFFPNNTVKIHIVDNGKNREPLSRLRETYSNLLKDYKAKLGNWSFIRYPPELDFEITYHSSDAIAMRALSRELGVRANKSTLLVVSSMKTMSYFESGMPRIINHPVFMMPGNKRTHSLDAFPWQPDVVKKMLTRFLHVGVWIQERHEHCSYHNVPLGNVIGDEALFFADVEFARRMWKRDCLLWWSPNPKPDLGGREHDSAGESDELSGAEICVPGNYSNVCLSIEVKDLAFNSVMQAAFVNELEGSGGTTAFDSTSHTLDELAKGETNVSATFGDTVLAPHILAELKALLRFWHADRTTSVASRNIIEHFGRWIGTKSSCMYDPGIHRFVHGLMKKVFLQMVAEFKRLGSRVVHGDFGSLLLVTSKPPGTAYAYANYLASAINGNDLFKYVALRTDRFYDHLLYLDKANRGGVVCIDPEALEPPPKVPMEATWNIQSFLPPFVQEYFGRFVNHFIKTLYLIHRNHSVWSRSPLKVRQQLTQDDNLKPLDDAEREENEETRDFIAGTLTRRMLHAVTEIVEEHREALLEPQLPNEFRFPLLPGSHLTMTNPALEFIKFTCAIFSAAQDYKLEVGLLKRNLLQFIGVREFSEEAEFRNPCDPFVLPMVICRHCNHMRDLDFCRDPDLLAIEGDGHRRGPPLWQCPVCKCEYDRRAIEVSLIDSIRRLTTLYQVQDLKCSKCGQIKSDNLMAHCKCSGPYALTDGKVETRRKLRTVVNVASYHNLGMLKEYTEFLLDHW
ncbi:uncharacterized protein EI90DRAFT_3145642 [Cantharellus anzutake]|uniref:uncharacterized protein n=1 Tax=Cantharellus anzutake TaxID=1750568 RepID=UPI00190532D8|nr:uncharacterized protein EI90DRAFT_3145642 [Cantharellus anzutake]KAF8331488.1 hypothetical protein EI90DRAFT_3145642 [Cantharellus anzutake]